MKTKLESLIEEAKVQAEEHPSKDARWFANSVREYLTQRQWVGLTEADLERLKLLTFEKELNAEGEEQEAVNLDQLIRATEQLCKEKNNG